MSAAPKPRLTPEQYLAIERKAEFRSEYFAGEMFAMAGVSRAHSRAKENLIGELYGRLDGSGCRTQSSDMRVKVSATGLYTYPDIVIVCGEELYEDAEVDTLLNPQVVIEVLSPSTEKYDRSEKYNHYRQIATCREYVLVAQDEPRIERMVRQHDGSWTETTFVGLDDEFAFDSVPVRIPMSKIYADVKFPEATSGK